MINKLIQKIFYSKLFQHERTLHYKDAYEQGKFDAQADSRHKQPPRFCTTCLEELCDCECSIAAAVTEEMKENWKQHNLKIREENPYFFSIYDKAEKKPKNTAFRL